MKVIRSLRKIRKISNLDIEDKIHNSFELKKIRLDNVSKNLTRATKKTPLSRIIKLYNQGHNDIANRIAMENIKYDISDIETMEFIIKKFDYKFKNSRDYCTEMILQIDPENIVVLEYKLEIALKNKVKLELSDVIKRIISINPNNQKVLEIEIIEKYKERNWGKVVESCKKVFKNNPLNRLALKKYSEAKYSLREYDESSRMFQKMMENYDLDDDEKYLVARTFYNSKKFQKSASLLEDINNEYFKTEWRELYVRSLYSNNDWLACNIECVKFLNNYPENKIALRYSGQSLINLGNLDEAKLYFDKICESDPYSVESWISIIECNMKIGSETENKIIWEKISNYIYSEYNFLSLGVEICSKFKWENRLSDILKYYSGYISINKENINFKLGTIFLKNGDLTLAWKFMRNSDMSNESLNLSKEIERVCKIVDIRVKEIEEALSKNQTIWIQEQVTRNLLSMYENRIRVKRKKPIILLISSSLNRGGAEKQVMLSMTKLNEGAKFESYLIVDKLDNKNNGKTYIDDLGKLINKTSEFGALEERKEEFERTISKEKGDMLNLLPKITKRRVLYIIAAIEKYNPDIIHAWQDEIIFSSSLATAIANGGPVLGSARSLSPEEKTNLHYMKRPYLKNCFKNIFKENNFHLSTNSIAGKKSYAKWLNMDPREIKVIYNGIDFKKMKKRMRVEIVNKKKNELGIRKNNKIIGGIFRLEQVKRPILWIECMEKCIEKDDNIRGLIVGDGKMMREVKKVILKKKLSDKIFTIGAVEDVAAWLKNIDIFLFTSSSEGLPNSIIEAQAFGVPVVSSNVGGVSEIIINGKTGWLIDSEKPLAYVSKIMQTIKNSENIFFKENAIKYSHRKFSSKQMKKDTERIYDEILKLDS